MKEYQNISHGFGPVYNSESRILILGSFPSVKSREQAFFYGHPRNRFWKVLAAVLKEEEPQTVEEKKAMLFRRGVAVYDVIEQCSIKMWFRRIWGKSWENRRFRRCTQTEKQPESFIKNIRTKR